MEKYTIIIFDNKDINIESENVYYCEACHASGCQTNNLETTDLVHQKCRQIADLIREIEILNK